MKLVFGFSERLSTKGIIENLCSLPEAPWGDLRGKAISDNGLADRLRPYGIKSKQIRIGDWTGKGYDRADFYDAWQRYLSLSPIESETAETPETAEAAE
ncbi:MAG: DUF3631 domain-containing protein [Mesorhizobium sp.]|nr:MAG: DUF3631 domain-containing protein [Mesorhizobium sp.]